MKIDFLTRSRNGKSCGWATVDSQKVFNFDTFWLSHSPEESAFLGGLTREWQEVPAELLDRTTRANFVCYARVPANQKRPLP